MGVRIVSIGAAVQDVFLSGKALTPENENGQLVAHLPLGAKMDLDNITFSTGGGATNGAVTFARQELDSVFMGKIARDPAGAAVLADLNKEGVNTDLVVYSTQYSTGYSTLLLAPSGERTILTYRGASTNYRLENFSMEGVEADWFFITSLAGSMGILNHIVTYAQSKNIKVALIPGKGELKQVEALKPIIDKCTILSANKEEMKTLFEGETIQDLARSAAKTIPFVVVTDGPKGEAASDGQRVCWGGMYEDVPVIDRTGAGDAFASGFTAMVAQNKSLEEAITFASANSTSVVSQIGAKAGILRKDARLHNMEIHSEPV